MKKEDAIRLKERLLNRAKTIAKKAENDKYGPKDYYKGKLEGLLFAVDMLCIYADILGEEENIHEYRGIQNETAY